MSYGLSTMEVVTLTPCGIDQSQSNMKKIIHCNWSIFYGVRLTTPIVDDPLAPVYNRCSKP